MHGDTEASLWFDDGDEIDKLTFAASGGAVYQEVSTGDLRPGMTMFDWAKFGSDDDRFTITDVKQKERRVVGRVGRRQDGDPDTVVLQDGATVKVLHPPAPAACETDHQGGGFTVGDPGGRRRGDQGGDGVLVRRAVVRKLLGRRCRRRRLVRWKAVPLFGGRATTPQNAVGQPVVPGGRRVQGHASRPALSGYAGRPDRGRTDADDQARRPYDGDTVKVKLGRRHPRMRSVT